MTEKPIPLGSVRVKKAYPVNLDKLIQQDGFISIDLYFEPSEAQKLRGILDQLGSDKVLHFVLPDVTKMNGPSGMQLLVERRDTIPRSLPQV